MKNTFLKVFLKKNIKYISKLYYDFVPKKIKQNIHKYVSSESLKQNLDTNLFTTIFFELRTRCNGTCSFCAASVQNETRSDMSMHFDLFKKVILELVNINYKGIIAFHVNSEPLLIKNIDEYIGFARKHLKEAWIQILSNGKSLNTVNGKKIIDAGIDELSLNIYNDDLKADLPKNVKKFEDEVLYKEFDKKNIHTGHANRRPDKKSINYNVFKRLLNEVLTNRAGTSPNKKSNKSVSDSYGFCEWPSQQFNITANGDVSQCCCDLSFSNPMGNVKTQSIEEIWYGQKFVDLRKNLQNGNRDNSPICSKCDFFGINKVPKNLLRKSIYYLIKHN